ncbi:hypothetical protein [Demequina sp. NBRC 110052]|uniref:hypothetical protein n=1 Tax=Demequina sp. NBRC 110052 TaxID=1570341 RepID=UPI0009FE6BA0|nr:hypothetical protein [Demequina sp. NBRC 110052]
MRNAVAFDIDPVLWLPLPRRSTLTDDRRVRWLDAAVTRAARNAAANQADLPEIERRCVAVLDGADEGEQCILFPLGEAEPTVARIASAPADAQWFARVDEATEGLGEGARVAREPRDHAAFEEAARIMRLERPARGEVRVRVLFAGHCDGIGVTLEGASRSLSAAGQLARAGAVVFDSFSLRGDAVG